jgi:hypothetical protein
VASLVAQAAFGFVLGVFAIEMGVQQNQHIGAIIRMHQVFPTADMAFSSRLIG